MDKIQALAALAVEGSTFVVTARATASAVVFDGAPQERATLVKKTWGGSKTRSIVAGMITPIGWVCDGLRYVVAGIGAVAGATIAVVSTVTAVLWSGLAWLVNAVRSGVNSLIDTVVGTPSTKAKTETVKA